MFLNINILPILQIPLTRLHYRSLISLDKLAPPLDFADLVYVFIQLVVLLSLQVVQADEEVMHLFV